MTIQNCSFLRMACARALWLGTSRPWDLSLLLQSSLSSLIQLLNSSELFCGLLLSLEACLDELVHHGCDFCASSCEDALHFFLFLFSSASLIYLSSWPSNHSSSRVFDLCGVKSFPSSHLSRSHFYDGASLSCSISLENWSLIAG